MIIKAKVRGGGAKLADYLLNEKKNERAELLEMRGFSVDSLKGALNFEEALAERATRCEKPFYHVAFRAAPGEELTAEPWRHCADKLEQALGMEGHNRALVMHEKDGGQHLHVVWSRIDPETLKVAELAFDYRRCKEVAREIERELGLQQVRDHAPERGLEPPTHGEEKQANRKGQKRQDLEQTRAAIREAWEESDDGRGFAAALKERGLELAQGERRDFVAVDEEGSVYSIGKRTTGARAADVREKLADLDRADLPTVEQTREQQREREEFNKLLSATMEPPKREREEPERAAIREAWDESEDGKGFTAALKERGLTLAQGEDRAYVAVDERGSVYGIDPRTKGGQAVDVREKLADLDNEYVPTVEHVRWQQHEREPERADAAPALDIAPGKGAARVLGAVLDAPANVIGGIVDFFVGSPPPEKPKEPERPRTKTIAERDAEDRAEKQAELDRRRAMTEEERREERERLRERERERYRDR